MDKIKLGQIGLGHNHGETKMLSARKFPNLFEVVGYAEPNEKWIEKRGGIDAYKGLTRFSVNELIEKCDALLIESDVWDLDKYAMLCIEKGKHIHMDKPAGKLGEFRALLKKAQKKALVVQMGYMYRYNPAILKCLEYIKSGELGEIYSINAEMSTFHSAEYREWLKNFNGGIMYILGSHLIDLIVYMMGKPKKTTSLLKNSYRDGVVVQDNNLAVLEYERALARINVSSVEVNGWGRRQFVVTGSKGTVEICPLENPTRMTYSNLSFNNKHYSDVKENVQINEVKMDCRYDQMMQDFYAFVKGEKQNPFTYSHDYTVQKVINKIVKGVKFYGNDID